MSFVPRARRGSEDAQLFAVSSNVLGPRLPTDGGRREVRRRCSWENARPSNLYSSSLVKSDEDDEVTGEVRDDEWSDGVHDSGDPHVELVVAGIGSPQEYLRYAYQNLKMS